MDYGRLEDATAIAAADPGEMLRAVAMSAAQVRTGATAAADAGIDRLTVADRPRAVVVLGTGASAVAGDILAALAGPTCPIPVLVSRGYTLPGWVGAADLVVAVSCSGRTPETLSATEAAVRRGAQVVGIGGDSSPLAELTARARGIFVSVGSVHSVHSSRTALWELATPLVTIGAALGLLDLSGGAIEAAAERLYGLALRCQPSSEPFGNPAKDLALSVAGTLPLAWGTTPLTGVAADRLVSQWAENAKAPALGGCLPDVAHAAVATLDGPWSSGPGDLFADREDTVATTRLHVLMLRDLEEDSRVAAQADAVRALAEERGLRLTELQADGASPYERLASLIGLIDYASVYLALLTEVDPSPTAFADALRAASRAGVAAR